MTEITAQEKIGELRWPPSKADLERLYLSDLMSMKGIAEMYSLRTPFRVRRLLDEYGISLRARGRVIPELVEEWVRRYQAGESLQQIAGRVTDTRTVSRYLRMQGLKIRTGGEMRTTARIMRDRAMFGEDLNELKRLYMEGLNCFQIAEKYGVTGQRHAIGQTIRRRLKRLGVDLRPRGAELRKFEPVAADWSRRYLRGDSAVDIAKGVSSSSTVLRYLHRRGTELRTKRYEKRSFNGTEQERAYLIGFTRGDMNVRRDCRLVRLISGSTHPAFIDLVTSLFAPFGPIKVVPTNSLRGFGWDVSVSLDDSFEFLLSDRTQNPFNLFSGGSLSAYLAGLFDAEGSLWVGAMQWFRPFWSLCNTDSTMLDWVNSYVEMMGFHPSRSRQRSDGLAAVRIYRNEEVAELVRMLPLRHPEKKAKARLVLDQRISPELKREKWCDLLMEIERDRNEMIRLAERELARRGKGADSATGRVTCLRYLSHWRRFPLNESNWLDTVNWLGGYVDG